MATNVNTSSEILNGDSPSRLVVTSQGAAATAVTSLGADSGKSAVKHSVVHRHAVNGQEVDMLIRAYVHNNCIFVDVVSGQSVAELTTTVAALNLAGVAPGHPAPTKDVTDAQAMVAAGGS